MCSFTSSITIFISVCVWRVHHGSGCYCMDECHSVHQVNLYWNKSNIWGLCNKHQQKLTHGHKQKSVSGKFTSRVVIFDQETVAYFLFLKWSHLMRRHLSNHLLWSVVGPLWSIQMCPKQDSNHLCRVIFLWSERSTPKPPWLDELCIYTSFWLLCSPKSLYDPSIHPSIFPLKIIFFHEYSR